jgi:hypothetical protein
LVAVVLATVPLITAPSAGAVPIVAPPVPVVVMWGSFTGTECVNITEPGTFHASFAGTFTGIPFLGSGTFTYDAYSTPPSDTSQGAWEMSSTSTSGSLSGTHIQAATRTITDGTIQVEFVDDLTVTSSSGAAAAVMGKLQGFGVRIYSAAQQQGCFLTFDTHGSLLPALHQGT